jgi:hypothetical protein
MTQTNDLQLDEPIVTGNTKAAVKAAGGGSSDLWTVPPSALHYDPRDNVRSLNWDRVRRMADNMKVRGYDRKEPLGGIVRKVDDEDRIYVYIGQHRYHAVLLAISEGAHIARVPIIIDDAKSVSRTNLIVAGVLSNDVDNLSPLDLAGAIADLRREGLDQATICEQLSITDQTVRDCALLESAPTGIHELVRTKVIAGTLAIQEIRRHGGEKALERLASAATEARASGKTKVTKKALAITTSDKISGVHAKQLLQALQSVLHDPLFGKLSPGTIAGVHTALMPLADLLDAAPKKRSHPIHTANKHGVFTDCEVIRAQAPRNRSGSSAAEICLAQPEEGTWIFSTSLSIGSVYTGSLPSLHEFTATFPTRGQALRAAVSEITRLMDNPKTRAAKGAKGVREWLDKLYAMPDPDWTEEMVDAAKGVS